jgi:hypothetical protein
MKPPILTIFAIFGIALAFSSCLAGIKTIFDAIFSFPELLGKGGVGDPAQLSAIIGEVIISFCSRGVLAVFPALLIYLSLVPLRLRSNWFYQWARLSSFSLLILFPFGSFLGCVLLVLLKRNKSQFKESGVGQRTFLP